MSDICESLVASIILQEYGLMKTVEEKPSFSVVQSDAVGELACPVCRDVLKNPVMHPACGNMFCSECVKSMTTCSVCHGSSTGACGFVQAPKYVQNTLKAMKVRCDGCKGEMTREEFESHGCVAVSNAITALLHHIDDIERLNSKLRREIIERDLNEELKRGSPSVRAADDGDTVLWLGRDPVPPVCVALPPPSDGIGDFGDVLCCESGPVHHFCVAEELSFSPPPSPQAAAAVRPRGSSSGRMDEVDQARRYIKKIKSRFRDNPEKFKAFLSLLTNYHKETCTPDQVFSQVKELFHDHPDLVEEFIAFLPVKFQQQARSCPAQADEAFCSYADVFGDMPVFDFCSLDFMG